MTRLSDSTRAKLSTVSVATLTTVLFKRGFRNQFIQDVHPLNPNAGAMVGEAFTLRYIPAREDLNPITVFKDRAHPQRKAVEDCPPRRRARPYGCRLRTPHRAGTPRPRGAEDDSGLGTH